jgi:hypothetical protein
MMPIVAEIKAIVAVKEFDHVKVGGLIGEIVHLLKDLIVKVKAIVALDLDLEKLLYLAGKRIDIDVLGKVVFALLALVVEVLYLVLHLVLYIDITLVNVIYAVGPVLIELVTIVLKLVPTLDVVLAVLVKVLVGPIGELHCDQILVLLKIAVSK